VTAQVQADRIAFKNLGADAVASPTELGVRSAAEVAEVADEITDSSTTTPSGHTSRMAWPSSWSLTTSGRCAFPGLSARRSMPVTGFR